MAEKFIERGLFASRWLMAPMYVGLVGALVILMFKFMQALAEFALHALHASEAETVLALLSLIDLTLAGNLLLIVVFSGYENFVSKIDVGDHEDQPDWKGKVDFAGLKLKLIASIVAISGIHLLKIFMDIPKYTDRDIMWMVIIHVVFVGSGVFLALMDRIHVQHQAEGPLVGGGGGSGGH
ncbi:MAG: TIGR00645 family protein [Siculibacillus sp.]|nr:TIGR00645 family protein [Siculibacillus sp.]